MRARTPYNALEGGPWNFSSRLIAPPLGGFTPPKRTRNALTEEGQPTLTWLPLWLTDDPHRTLQPFSSHLVRACDFLNLGTRHG